MEQKNKKGDNYAANQDIKGEDIHKDNNNYLHMQVSEPLSISDILNNMGFRKEGGDK